MTVEFAESLVDKIKKNLELHQCILSYQYAFQTGVLRLYSSKLGGSSVNILSKIVQENKLNVEITVGFFYKRNHYIKIDLSKPEQ